MCKGSKCHDLQISFAPAVVVTFAGAQFGKPYFQIQLIKEQCSRLFWAGKLHSVCWSRIQNHTVQGHWTVEQWGWASVRHLHINVLTGKAKGGGSWEPKHKQPLQPMPRGPFADMHDFLGKRFYLFSGPRLPCPEFDVSGYQFIPTWKKEEFTISWLTF